MAPKKGDTTLRIDMQGGATRGAESWANIQCQVGSDSVAGIICPFDTPIVTVKEGLNKALDEKDMLEWKRDAAATNEDPRLPGDWVKQETADADHVVLPAGSRLPYF